MHGAVMTRLAVGVERDARRASGVQGLGTEPRQTTGLKTKQIHLDLSVR